MVFVGDHSGYTADANILINYARVAAQRYRFTYNEPEPVEELVRTICDMKHGYTQYGGNATCALFGPPVLLITKVHRPPSIWRFLAFRWMGHQARLPAVPERPKWQLQWLEGYCHWQ